MDNISPESWKSTLRSAVAILRDLEKKGFGRPDFTMGGGTVLTSTFQARDVFDMAAAIAMDPTSVATAARMAASKAAILDRRLGELSRLSVEELERGILLLEGGRGLVSGMLERVRTFIADVAAR